MASARLQTTRSRMSGRTGWTLDPGTQFLTDGNVRFRVWAPFAKKVDLVLHRDGEERIRMETGRFGYHSKTVAADQPWTDDAPIAARLKEQGAIALGKTTTPEFGWKEIAS